MTRAGLVGCGVISKVYAEKLNALPFVELAACADLDGERARALAEAHGIPRVLGVHALLADPAIDVVVNLTVPQAHVQVSRAAIEAGKSVYSEKPLGLALGDGRALVEAADRAGLRLGCAPDTFLGGGLQTCRKLIDDGAIGEPVGANAFMLSPGPERWHPGPQIFYQRGAGPLFDMAPYYLTALVMLLGPARRVTGSARMTHAQREIGSEPLRGQKMDVEVPTHVASVVDFESGPVATLVTSFDVQASRYRNLEIYGTEGTLSVPDPNSFGGPVQVKRSAPDEWQDVPLTHANTEQSRGIGLGDMLVAMQSGRAHRASGELALHVLELMEGSIRASESGAHVDLTTTCERPDALPPGLADDAFDAGGQP
ncbi:MAG: Gfo/Idh/MocA family oxidoreductase [Deltaproteobacteria bacterium]|nr:Gfo/Idh/MocA family oxidoreductase [Deltaproteobacteria bacterium]MBW2415747.1 Gfo/Idh/MocA family oxidoreductase [Deltaproteobacteria bacterium]